MYGGHSKLYNDPIHGSLVLEDTILPFIDTPQFQRLRDLKQLGVTAYIFAGAVHDRFGHSVGVYHLSRQVVEGFRLSQPELDISEQEATAVKVAGLLHGM